jgi:ribosomal protein L40E
MFCPKCGAENLPTSKFCQQCGAPLAQAPPQPPPPPKQATFCPKCGAENLPTSKSCQQCGAPLTQPLPPSSLPPQPPSPPKLGVICPKCHKMNPSGSKSCQKCGTSFPPELEASQQPFLEAHQRKVKKFLRVIGIVGPVVVILGGVLALFFGPVNIINKQDLQNMVVIPPVGPLTSEWEGTWAIDGEDVVSDTIVVEYHYTGKFSFTMSNHPEGWIDIVGSGTAEGTATETNNGKQSSDSFINTYKVNQWYNGTVIVFDDVEPAYFPTNNVGYDYEGTIFESAGFCGDTSVGLHIYTDIKIADIKDGATLIGYGRSRWDSEPNKIVMHLKKVSSSGLTTMTVSAKGDVLTSIYEDAEGDQRDNISAIKTELRNASREELEKALEEIYQYDKEYWISPTNVYRTLLFQVRANRSIQEIRPEEIEGYEFFGRTITKLSILWAENVQASGWADDPEMMSRVIGEMTTKNAILEEGTIISDHYKKLK